MAEGKAVFHDRSILDKASRKNGKLDKPSPLAQPPKQHNTTSILSPRHTRSINQILRCPECGSTRLYKDGLRYLADGTTVQRWLCRECSYRFSDKKPLQSNLRWQINTPSASLSNRQVCDCLIEASKNLAEVETRQEPAPREGTITDAETIKGLIVKYVAWLEKEGYDEKSAYPKLIHSLAKTANLYDPEDVKRAIGKLHCKDGTKMLCVYAYDAFAKMEKIAWERPKYKQEESLPFVPDERELDELIAACQSKRMSAFLQTLKETYADPGEVLKLRWIDISGNIITINNPVKGHLPGQIEVTNKLLAMLNRLPKTSERIFPTNYSNVYTSFDNVRRRAARSLQNPRLLKISFKSFRHWGGSMIAHYTNGNVLTVKKLLRHKRIENTMKYISMLHFKDDEFEVTTATTVEEAKQVLSTGFDYVTEKNGIMLFRRPKRFRGLNAGIGV